MNIKILITGAGGYIGSIATYLFLQNGYEIVALDNYSTGYRQPLELLQQKFGGDKLRIYEADLKDNLSSIIEKEKDIAAVVHYAASCLVDESMKKPEKYLRNNILGTLNLLENMVKYSINSLVFSSTAAVYGESEHVPISEEQLPKPINVYGESKLADEKIIFWYGKLKGIRYCNLRYFNVCGASEDGLIGDSKKPSTLLVQNAVRGALGIDQFYLNCPEVPTKDKTPIRDYINVVDLNEAHLKAVEYLLNGGKSETLNLGTGTGNSVGDIISKVQEVTGAKFKVEKTTPREGDPVELIASINKAEKVLGWKPKRTIEDSVRSLVKWYKAHSLGWEK